MSHACYRLASAANPPFLQEAIIIGIQERKEREKNEKRERILQAAKEIMKDEGIENISIRKIADKIEYSPAIVYHYFKDKEEILNQIVMGTYHQMTEDLSSFPSTGSPEDKLKMRMRKFIERMTTMGDEYKMIMLNESPAILDHTAVLFKGASTDRPALGVLRQSLQAFYHAQDRLIEDDQIEITAQIIWTSMFGLILRIITEKVEEKQKRRLIDEFLEFCILALN